MGEGEVGIDVNRVPEKTDRRAIISLSALRAPQRVRLERRKRRGGRFLQTALQLLNLTPRLA